MTHPAILTCYREIARRAYADRQAALRERDAARAEAAELRFALAEAGVSLERGAAELAKAYRERGEAQKRAHALRAVFDAAIAAWPVIRKYLTGAKVAALGDALTDAEGAAQTEPSEESVA